MKPIDELTFIDDYMFGEVMKSKEICIGVLERLTGLEIEDIEYPELQKSLKPGDETHGIRLDVYVKNRDAVYDIELQNKHYNALGKRMRFYQSLIDADSLLKGADYEALPKTIIIFICTTDPFSLGLPKYTFRTTCAESDMLNLDDNAEKIIYNASAYADVSNSELGAFLRFVSEDKSSDSFTEKLKERVYGIKADEIFRKEYMGMGIWESDIRKEAVKEGYEAGVAQGMELGMEQGIAQGLEQGLERGIEQGGYNAKIEDAKAMLADGMDINLIAKYTGLTVETIKAELG